MDLLKVFSNKTTTPKDVAKDRLKLILIHDRGDIDPETIDKIRERFGNTSVMRCSSLQEHSTEKNRLTQIGGHRA